MEIVKVTIVTVVMFLLTAMAVVPLSIVYGFWAIPLSCFVGGCIGYVTASVADKWIN